MLVSLTCALHYESLLSCTGAIEDNPISEDKEHFELDQPTRCTKDTKTHQSILKSTVSLIDSHTSRDRSCSRSLDNSRFSCSRSSSRSDDSRSLDNSSVYRSRSSSRSNSPLRYVDATLSDSRRSRSRSRSVSPTQRVNGTHSKGETVDATPQNATLTEILRKANFKIGNLLAEKLFNMTIQKY